MKALIIPFPIEHVQRKRPSPLSKLMIDKLLAAYSLEKQNLFFGPHDIKGSLTSLINRGLIVRIEIPVNGKRESIWHVSYEAIEMLKALGIDVICLKPRVKGVVEISFLSLVEPYGSAKPQARCLPL